MAQSVGRMFRPRASARLDRIEELLELASGGTLGQAGSLGLNDPFRSTVALRVVTLVAHGIGWLITEGHLRVTDRHGDVVDNRRTRAVLDLMCGVPDGDLQAESFWTDHGAEFAIHGNALVLVRRDDMGKPARLELLDASGAEIIHGSRGNRMYRASLLDDPSGRVFEIDRSDVIHARWPRLGRGGSRQGFARSPLAELNTAIQIALASDKYILDFFGKEGGSVKSQLAVGIDKMPSKEQFDTLMQQLRAYSKPGSRTPLVVGGSPNFFQLKSSPSDAETSKLREIQAREVARVFGAPPPVIGENVTNWGQGIGELVRMFYRFGLRHHLGAVLAASSARLLKKSERFSINESIINRGDPRGSAALMHALRGGPNGKALASDRELRQMAGLPSVMEGESSAANEPTEQPPDTRINRNRESEGESDV